MKKYLILFFALILAACTQDSVEIVNKNNSVFKPNYTEHYIESPDGKMVRSLKGTNDSDKAQEISIIKEQKNENINNNIKETKTTIITYVVKSGDNLSNIARKNNTTINSIIELNNLKKPYIIKVGQKLKINQNKIKQESQESIYIVKKGDNLISIAKKNNISTDKLAKLNNLQKPYTIKIGQKLKIADNIEIINPKPVLETKNTTTTPNTKTTPQKQNIAKINTTENKQTKTSFVWPVNGKIISSFGNKSSGLYNDGINIAAKSGTEFKSTRDGVVAYVGNELRGYGTIILIKHDTNWISAYAHCGSVKVSRGDKVKQGQVIGTIGQTGNVSEPQLYFSLRKGREAVDPIKYLPNN